MNSESNIHSLFVFFWRFGDPKNFLSAFHLRHYQDSVYSFTKKILLWQKRWRLFRSLPSLVVEENTIVSRTHGGLRVKLFNKKTNLFTKRKCVILEKKVCDKCVNLPLVLRLSNAHTIIS